VATVGVRRFWHGCIDSYVMPVGGVDRTETLVDALTSCRFGFGSVFQLADHTAGQLRYIQIFCSLFMQTYIHQLFIFQILVLFCRLGINRILGPLLGVWKTATVVRGPPGSRYKFYTNELDCLTQAQVKTHVHQFVFNL
jgi:hypothetical protein